MQIKKIKTGKVIILIIVMLAVAVFIYIRILKEKAPKPSARSESPIDITPLIVAKLQQLVREGSDGLYRLSIEQLKPDITSSRVDIIKASLIPDSAVLQKLDKASKAPDDVFTVSFNAVHVTGVNIDDFLHKKTIRLDSIFVSSPLMEVAHTDRPYNAAERAKDSAFTLYQKLTQQFRSIAIGAIVVKEGTFITTNFSQQKKITRLNGVDIQLSDLQIDSSTQYDKNRFLFCKTAAFSCKDYVARTPDSLYLFKVGSFSVSADKHVLRAKGVALEPRGDKEAFEKKLKTRNDMFTVRFPDMVCMNIDWWALINNKSFYADEVMISNGSIKDYFNRALPSGPAGRKDDFPQQLLMQVPLSINIGKLQVSHLKVLYEEYSPQSKQSGMLTFDDIKVTMNNITNMRDRIKMHPFTICSATGLFMNQVPVTAHIQFDLSKLRTGVFSSDFHIGALTNTLINGIAEPMGMFTIKSGTIEQAKVHVAGDNFKAKTNITMLYHDLRIFPLKNPDSSGNLKKKSIVGFFANAFAIKDSNPAGKKPPRSPEVIAQRGDSGTFFNFIWKAILTGIVKTIGVPKKFANQ